MLQPGVRGRDAFSVALSTLHINSSLTHNLLLAYVGVRKVKLEHNQDPVEETEYHDRHWDERPKVKYT